MVLHDDRSREAILTEKWSGRHFQMGGRRRCREERHRELRGKIRGRLSLKSAETKKTSRRRAGKQMKMDGCGCEGGR